MPAEQYLKEHEPGALAHAHADDPLAEAEAVLFLIRLARLRRQHRLVRGSGAPESFWRAAADAYSAGELSAAQWAALHGPWRQGVIEPALRQQVEVALVLGRRAPLRVIELLVWRQPEPGRGLCVQPRSRAQWHESEGDFVRCMTGSRLGMR